MNGLKDVASKAIMVNTDGVCLHIFTAYKVVDKNGNETLLNSQITLPLEGTHYGYCYYCGKWIDLTHARIATEEEMEKWRGARFEQREKVDRTKSEGISTGEITADLISKGIPPAQAQQAEQMFDNSETNDCAAKWRDPDYVRYAMSKGWR